MKQKKILINGAGRGCLNLLKAAKKMGLYTIVTGKDGPCIPMANAAYREVHPGIPEEVLEVAQKENVDAIVTCGNDMGLPSVGFCCDKLNLTGISYEAAKLTTNKLQMKEKLIENGIRTPKFKKINNSDDLKKYVTHFNYPLVLKAVDLQGSRGVYIVNDYEELEKAYNEIKKISKKGHCIIEEFIKGKEFGAQAFVYNKQILFILPHGDEMFMSGTTVPIGHYMPLFLEKDIKKDLETQATTAINAIGLDNCAVNIDFIEKDGKAYVIELTGRGGANGLTDITGLYFGFNYYDMMIRLALGENPEEIYKNRLSYPRVAVSKMLTSEKYGRINNIKIPQVQNGYIELFIKPGDEVRKFQNSNDAIGELIVSGETMEECEDMIRLYLSNLIIETVKE